MERNLAQPRTSSVKPLAIWKWGFSIALIVVGLWLVLAQPTVMGGDGELFGWILIGYSLVRLLLSYLMNLSRGVSWKR